VEKKTTKSEREGEKKDVQQRKDGTEVDETLKDSDGHSNGVNSPSGCNRDGNIRGERKMLEQLSFEDVKERNRMFKILKAQGVKLRRWTERNQEVGYRGFGSERNRTRRSVYMLDVER
jgi:hypothetical protein